MAEIYIYHTNDLHSHFEHWPRIANFLDNRKSLHEEIGDSVFLFDIGDHMDRWHPLSDATRGKANTELLNASNYDAVTIGNNEGITLPFENLDTMYTDANFHVLVANLYKEDESRPQWVKPFSIYQTDSGVKIGVIGVTAYYPNFYDTLGWRIKDPIEELSKLLDIVKKEVDVVILLSHLGLNDDEQIAQMFPDIDVILGGHTHHILHEGKIVNNSLLGAAGKFGMYVGQMVLSIDDVTNKVIKKKAVLIDTNELPPVDGETESVEKLYSRGKKILDTKIEGIELKSGTKQSLAKLLCEALNEWSQADCAFLNEGLILKEIKASSVSKYDLLTICPHPINPCIVELTGAELKEVLLETLDPKWRDLHLKGLGFRGTLVGRIIHEGIEFDHKGLRVEIRVNGEVLDKEKVYRLAIPDMFTFGRFFPEIHRAKHKTYLLPEFMRDLLSWKLRRLG